MQKQVTGASSRSKQQTAELSLKIMAAAVEIMAAACFLPSRPWRPPLAGGADG